MGRTFSLALTREGLGFKLVSTWRRSLVNNLIVGGVGGLGGPSPSKGGAATNTTGIGSREWVVGSKIGGDSERTRLNQQNLMRLTHTPRRSRAFPRDGYLFRSFDRFTSFWAASSELGIHLPVDGIYILLSTCIVQPESIDVNHVFTKH